MNSSSCSARACCVTRNQSRSEGEPRGGIRPRGTGTHNVDRSLTQGPVLLLELLDAKFVGFQLDLEDPVLLLQTLDALVQLLAGDGRRRHHDGAAVDAARITLAAVSHADVYTAATALHLGPSCSSLAPAAKRLTSQGLRSIARLSSWLAVARAHTHTHTRTRRRFLLYRPFLFLSFGPAATRLGLNTFGRLFADWHGEGIAVAAAPARPSHIHHTNARGKKTTARLSPVNRFLHQSITLEPQQSIIHFQHWTNPRGFKVTVKGVKQKTKV